MMCCGAPQVSAVLQVQRDFEGGGPRTLVKCAACGLVFLDPRPSPEELAALLPAYQERTQWILEELRASWFGRFAIRLIRSGRLKRRKLGDTLDIDIDFITDAENRLERFPPNSFDRITMWQVLEHADHPPRVLAQVERVLRPGGQVVVEVPNYASIWARIFGRFWFPLELPFHLYQFSPATLSRMLRNARLEVKELTGEPAPAQITWCLDVLWRHLRGKPWRGRLLWSPTAVIALYPLEAMLAKFRLSNHFRVTAVKPE
jgi:SAM-dependent methyltransferase